LVGGEHLKSGKYLKLQIATIDQLLAGKRPDLPPIDPTMFAKAAKETPVLAELSQLPESERFEPRKK